MAQPAHVPRAHFTLLRRYLRNLVGQARATTLQWARAQLTETQPLPPRVKRKRIQRIYKLLSDETEVEGGRRCVRHLMPLKYSR